MEMLREPVSGGNVHTVERLPGGLIAKTRHTGNPEGLSMYTVAEDMMYEAAAIRDAYVIMPNNFPELMDSQELDKGQIVMRELFPGDAVTLKDHLLRVGPSKRLIGHLATLTARYHRLSDETTEMDDYRDGAFFSELLEYRYLALGLPELGSVVEDLIDDRERGVIHGGLSPKNILLKESARDNLAEQDIAFVDLETACIGSRYFDIGFNLGHIILHGVDHDLDHDEMYDSYLQSYEQEARRPLNQRLLKRVVFATMLYRLLHPETKYQLATIDSGIHKDLYEQYRALSSEGDE